MARTSYAWRRRKRVITKWDPFTMSRRFKKLMPIPRIGMAPELGFELDVLDWLEKACYEILEAQAVPTDLWQYYVGYAKRQWERILKFGGDTLVKEKISIKNEYILRGLSSAILDLLDPVCLKAAQYKWTATAPPKIVNGPAGNAYLWFLTSSLIGDIISASSGAYLTFNLDGCLPGIIGAASGAYFDR